MVMAVKYQIFQCKRPQDVLLITLNHIDEIRNFMSGEDNALELLDHTYSLLYSVRYSTVVNYCGKAVSDSYWSQTLQNQM